jgi:hypothetical protein
VPARLRANTEQNPSRFRPGDRAAICPITRGEQDATVSAAAASPFVKEISCFGDCVMMNTAKRLLADIRELAPGITARTAEIEAGRRIRSIRWKR